MQRISARVLTLFLGVSVVPAAVGQVAPTTPAGRYRSLVDERDRLPDALQNAATAEEGARLRERLSSLPSRFLLLAEEFPRDPIAVEALVQVVGLAHGSAFLPIGENTPGDKALALLAREHVASDKGVIRRKWPGAPGAKAMDAAIEIAIRDAEKDSRASPK